MQASCSQGGRMRLPGDCAMEPSLASKGANPQAAERASVRMYSALPKCANAAASEASLSLTAASAASLVVFDPGLGVG